MVTSGREQRTRQAPKVVAIGGGTGLSALLRGLKAHTPNITAVVTVADDGGSSGRLRREMGVLPPGDLRNCIAALADDEALMTQLFQYRFGKGSGLDGHCFGNLFITALAGVTGSFERAILETARVLAVQGRILPSTLQNVTLVADVRNGIEENAVKPGLTRVLGESSITKAARPIERLSLRPEGVRAYPEAVRAILEADLIVAGPGSLFTSVLPNLLVQDIARAVNAASATKLYICNVATQPGETDGFDVGAHVEALHRHVGWGMFRYALANESSSCVEQPNVVPVALSYPADNRYQVIIGDMTDPAAPWRHHSSRLAERIMAFYAGQRADERESALNRTTNEEMTL